MPQDPRRLDHLLLTVLGHCCREYIEPHANFPLWDNGLGALAEKLVERIGVPQYPVISIQVGNMTIPVQLVGGALRYAGLLPQQEAGRVGA